MISDVDLFERPWRGPCATTLLTMEQFRERLEDCTARPMAQAAAVWICRAYGIVGLCDPAYIANVIEAEVVRLGKEDRP